MRLLTWILKLYPLAWRTRYETEMLALLAEHHITFLTVLDLLFSALDARLDPYYKSERMLFSFKSVRTASMAFIIAIAIATFCMFIWHTQVTIFHPLPIETANTFVLIAGHTYFDGLYLALFASNVLIAAIYVKRAIAARHTRTVLLAAICFAIPFIIMGLVTAGWQRILFLPSQIITTFRYILMLFGGLELLMGGVLITITKAREAIAEHKKRLLLFVVFVTLLLILFVNYLYQSFFDVPGGLYLSSLKVFSVMMEYMVVSLFPFLGIGTLLLAVTSGEMSKRALRVALIAASLITLAMVVNLLAASSWEFIYWVQRAQAMSPWSLFDGRLLVMPIAVMVVATGIALVALRQGFLALAVPSITTREAEQAQPPQVQPPQILR